MNRAAKSISLPPQISEILPLNLSEKPAPCNAAVVFDDLLRALQVERDRLAAQALPGTVQGETKGSVTYYRRYWYDSQKKRAVNQTIPDGIVGHTRDCCAAWRKQRDMERAIADLCKWRSKHSAAFTIE